MIQHQLESFGSQESHFVFITIEGLINTMPHECSLPLHLRYIEKVGLIEISNILAESPKKIRERLKLGLDKLSFSLKSKGFNLAGIPLMNLLSRLVDFITPADKAKEFLHRLISEVVLGHKSAEETAEPQKAPSVFEGWKRFKFKKQGRYLRHLFAKYHQYW